MLRLPSNQSLLTVLSGAATAAITFCISKSPLVFASFGVLVAHEYGHYFAAKEAGSVVKSPIFMPGIFTMVGGTYIKDTPEVSQLRVILSGGMNGLLTVGLLITLVNLFGLPQLTLPLVGIGLYEVISMTIGKDGKRYRLTKRSLNDNGLIATGKYS